ncbi:MAG: carboxypeptidase-like regulatory domain-containing protein [Bacteroidetes bacterium]|nr:carboxypeptidase-like regulatory domain-containing protein [Bacteroidota bacterium]
MKQFNILLLLLTLAFQIVFAGDEISGIVKDRSSGKVLTYATISLADGRTGVISDESGSFMIEVEEQDTIVISYVGYQTLRLTPSELSKSNICLLEPYVFPIDEVIITPFDAEDILRKAYDDFYKNHVHTDMATYGYYREQIFEDQRCVRFGEAVFSTRFYEKDGKDMAGLEPYLARSLDDSTFLKKLNGIFNTKRMMIPIGMDAYQDNNMVNSFKVDQYYEFIGDFFFGKAKNGFKVDYRLSENYMQDGRQNYFITFNIHKKKTHIATGHILIDQATYGIAAFEIGFREQENLTKMLLPPKIRLAMKIFGYGVNIGDYEARLYNHYEDGRWFIGRGVQVLQGGIAKKKEWINGKLVNEFHAYYSADYEKPEKVDFKDERVYDFSTDFWKGYQHSPIQPLQQQYIEKIIARNGTFSGEVLSKKVQAKLAAKEAKKQGQE